MNLEAMEARLKALEGQVAGTELLKARIKDLEKQVTTLQDIEEIKTLQKAYGYYLEHWMSQEVIDCFSDSPDCVLKLYEGIWLGKDGIRRYFDHGPDTPPETMHQVMQISGIVHVEPDGKTAKGRWYSWGACAIPMGGGVRQFFMNGIYEMVYIKENGVWKILKLDYTLHFGAPPDKGWVAPERIAAIDMSKARPPHMKADISTDNDIDTKYPSGYIFPFHFKHPVTGQPTSEARRNAAQKFKPRGPRG